MAFWTPQEDDILINMVNGDKEVNEIMVALNKGRDQVAGRIRRLRAAGTLPTPDKPSSSERTTRPRVKKPKKSKSTKLVEPKPKKPKEPPYVPEPRPLHPLEQLGFYDCRWPIGDPGTLGFHFCGEPVTKHSPYCQSHADRAFTGTGRVREDKTLEPAE